MNAEDHETGVDENTREDEQRAAPEKIFHTGSQFKVKKITPETERRQREGFGKRSKARSSHKTGRYAGFRVPGGKVTDLAFDATLRAAAPHQVYRDKNGMAIAVKNEDIREKVREKKIGNTILFIVDSSGSMGAQQRMVETKGAVMSLLVDAYQKRDRVGLIAFRGKKAEVLLEPTSSVELAHKRLEIMPTGGKTPLSHGLLKGLNLVRKELKKNNKIKPLLVLISDGKANVSINPQLEPYTEVKQIAEMIRDLGIESLLIDTEKNFVRLGRLRELAESINGRYHYLDEIKANSLSGLVRNLVE